MLSINRRISCDVLRVDTRWLKKPELNVGDVFNQQILDRKGNIDWSYVWLSEKESREINEQEDERESAFFQKIDLQSQNVGIDW